ncbi:hypothetical protein FACS1894184_10700 [Clostridia bacterium]|nr:hypothetical protein FACS1894184_10700 [Clostridia bacterium]
MPVERDNQTYSDSVQRYRQHSKMNVMRFVESVYHVQLIRQKRAAITVDMVAMAVELVDI